MVEFRINRAGADVLLDHLPQAPQRDQGGQRYALTLQALPDTVPALNRLRSTPECLLRSFRELCRPINRLRSALKCLL